MHITLFQALFLGVLQGVAELFPVSSLAQTILIPALLKWNFSRDGNDYLAFVVALHLATAAALVLYYRRDWVRVVRAYLGSITRRRLVYDRDSKFAWLLVAGTVIVGVAGLVGEHPIQKLFNDQSLAWIVGVILAVNGVFMIFGDVVKKQKTAANPAESEHSTGPSKTAEDLTFPQATAVGAAQTFALLPGVSRSGMTIVGGLLAGLSYEEAVRFSFMLATPVIGLAAVLKVPKLLHEDHQTKMYALYSSLAAFVAAYLSVKFLVRYFHSNRLSPFGYFCIVFGTFAAVWLKIHPLVN